MPASQANTILSILERSTLPSIACPLDAAFMSFIWFCASFKDASLLDSRTIGAAIAKDTPDAIRNEISTAKVEPFGAIARKAMMLPGAGGPDRPRSNIVL